jgi:beta-glucosidase
MRSRPCSQAWYPGQRGGEAIARILFGARRRSTRPGRLPITLCEDRSGGPKPTISFDVTNSGQRPGADVPQIYVEGARGTPYRLAGFQKVALRPGETQRVAIALEPRTYARFDARAHRWVIDGGARRYAIGRSATETVAQGTLALTAATIKP